MFHRLAHNSPHLFGGILQIFDFLLQFTDFLLQLGITRPRFRLCFFRFLLRFFSLLTLASGSLYHTWRSWRTSPCVVAPRIVVLVLSTVIVHVVVLLFLHVLHFLLTAAVGVVAPRIVVIVLSTAIASCLSFPITSG